MPSLKISNFDGVVPRMSATMLAENQAQVADNVKLYSRELRYWKGPTLDYTPAVLSGIKTIYKHYVNPSGSPTYYWLTWDEYVDVGLSPTTDTSDYRLYYTGDGTPKKTNATLTTTGSGAYPRSYLEMGVPAPAAAPGLTRVGAGSVVESRAYVYTYVSTFGALTEESAPSPPATVDWGTGNSITVNGFSAAPTTNYNITHIRIYRTATGSDTTSYAFVAQITIATASYSDSIATASLGEAIGTIGWDAPPATLSGLVAHPSGSFAGFVGNTVYFSEPFYPHAWPTAYALNVPATIIGLGVYGTSIVVMTDRYPHIITGTAPGGMSVERVPILEPCVSKQSIAADETGVIYASPNGLVNIGPGTRGLVSQNLFKRDEWQAEDPTRISAATADGRYFAVNPLDGTGRTMVISRNDVPALSYLDLGATAVHVDSKNGSLYYVGASDGLIYLADDDEITPLTFVWRSKRFVLPRGTPFSAIKLDADYSQIDDTAAYNAQVAAVVAANTALFAGTLTGELNGAAMDEWDVNGDELESIPPLASVRSAQVLIYGDGELVAGITLSDFDPHRLPPFNSREIEIEISGTLYVRAVTIATTVTELRP